ncbi:hypothetical protein J6T93_08165 [bacterium]|nr:hypothetical protein [bacterium]
MSSIRDIIKTEEEAAAIVANAKSQAEEIKKEGKEKAAAILKAADSKRDEELAREKEKIIAEEQAAAEKEKAELEKLLASREKKFSEKKEDIARSVLEGLLES